MLSAIDINIIKMLQEDLPLVSEPYKLIAEELGITENDLINKIKEFQDNKTMRRFGATLNHLKVGFQANAMVVWDVPIDKIEKVSRIMISFPQVSHCYERATPPGWSYNVFTMIHGLNKLECDKVVSEISDLIHVDDYDILYSSDELKKCSMKYFSET